jgi:hypothetical protein
MTPRQGNGKAKERKDGKSRLAVARPNGGKTGSKRPRTSPKISAERLSRELDRVNTRITRDADWIRSLSNDLRRLGEKVYGLTEGRVTLADVKLPIGRYRTPDQMPLAPAEIMDAAQRMTELKQRFLRLEKDLATADDLRARLEEHSPSS